MIITTGDLVEVKEGGNVYRAARVVKFDEGIGSLDLVYDDGEKENGVPINLVRKPKGCSNASMKPGVPVGPPGMIQQQSSPSAPASSPNAPTSRRKKDKDKARQCYELIKKFSESEQDAAFNMLLALDSVRPKSSR